MRGQEVLNLVAEAFVIQTGLVDERGALFGPALQRRVKDSIDLFPLFRLHTQLFPGESSDRPSGNARESHGSSNEIQEISLFISLRSHALASVQSRITVPGETPNTLAVSSMLSPPKKRSSTI